MVWSQHQLSQLWCRQGTSHMDTKVCSSALHWTYNLLHNNAPVDHNELITERKIGVYQNRKRFSWTKPTPLQNVTICLMGGEWAKSVIYLRPTTPTAGAFLHAATATPKFKGDMGISYHGQSSWPKKALATSSSHSAKILLKGLLACRYIHRHKAACF